MASISYDSAGQQIKANNLDLAGYQGSATVAPMVGGGYLAAWYSPGTNGSVRARLFTASGSAVADEFTIASDYKSEPIAIALTNGNILVGYSHSLTGTNSDVRAMLLSSTGVKSATDFAVVTGSTNDRLTGLAPLPGGGFVVVYTRTFGTDGDDDVRARIFNASGTAVGNELQVSSILGSLASRFGTVAVTNSGFVVAYSEGPADPDVRNDDLYLRRYAFDGTPLSSATLIDGGGTLNVGASLIGLADGGFVLAYSSNDTPNQVVQIKVRIYNVDGSARSSVVTVSSDSNANYFSPSLATLANGGFALSYTNDSNSKTYISFFNATGAPFGAELRSLSNVSASQITMLASGDIALAASVDTKTADVTDITTSEIEFRRTTIGDTSNEVLVGDQLVDFMGDEGGNDVFAGLGNDDYIDGGPGVDMAAYTGGRSDYLIGKIQYTSAQPVITIRDIRAGTPDGLDQIKNIEKVNFNGATTSVETFTPRNFNRDLKSDLAWYNDATGSSVVFLMNGLTSTSGVVVGPANGASWDLMATGDLNGDGQSDMIWQNTSGQVVGYIMNGTSIASAAVIGSPGASFRVVGVGDLNADGNSDIILQDGNGQAVAWLMNGTTIQSAAGIGPANGAAWSIKAVGDLNGDSRADLVWQNTDGSTVGYIMNGATIVAANQIGGALGANWSVKGIGDLNGDFAGDIVWQYSNGQAGVWLMNGTSIAAAQGIGAANGSQFEIRDIADLNGDARMDLVWENMSTGQAVGFLMSGSTILAAANIGGANGADWKIV